MQQALPYPVVYQYTLRPMYVHFLGLTYVFMVYLYLSLLIHLNQLLCVFWAYVLNKFPVWNKR